MPMFGQSQKKKTVVHFRMSHTSCLQWDQQNNVPLNFPSLVSLPQSLASTPWSHFLNKICVCKHLPQSFSFGLILAKTHMLFPVLRIFPLSLLNLSENIFSVLIPSFSLPFFHFLKGIFLSLVFHL